MTKKNNITMDEYRQLVAGESWVKTPYKYTMLGAGLSLIQQQALLMVSGFLQQYIKDFYNLKRDRSKARPKALFTDHVLRNGLPPMRIWLQDLGVAPNNYKEARRAIDEINLKVEHPEMDDNGNFTGRTLLTNVFSQFGFEDTGQYYHFGDADENGERQATAMQQPWIDVKINPDVAQWAFDMSAGYVNHLKMIALYSSKRPTPRLYLLLMNGTKKGERTVTIPFGELKQFLGIVPYKDKEGRVVEPYPKFASFRQKVLDAVRDDLQRMAGLNPPKTDITFDYEPVYPGSRRKGDPEAILFHVERTILGDAYNVVVNHEKMPPKQLSLFTNTDDPYRQVFADTIRRILTDTTDEHDREAYTRLAYEHYDDRTHSLLLQVDSRQHYDWVESDAIRPTFFTHLQQSFPGITTLRYRVVKAEKLSV